MYMTATKCPFISNDVDLKCGPASYRYSFGERHIQITLAFFGTMIHGLQCSSMGVGLVAMGDISANSKYTVLNYTMSQKGLITGMLGYGNTFGNIVAGYLSYKYDPIVLVPVASGFFSGSMSFLLPTAAIYLGFQAACLVTLLQGLGLSFIYPCVYAHISKWVIPQEQGKFSWVWSGNQVGHLIMMIITSPLHSSQGGWPSIYYVPGIIGILWGIAFFILAAESPAAHRTISQEEKDFIEMNLPSQPSGHENIKKRKLPWQSIVTSTTMWALLLVQISDLWTNNSLLSPIFFSSVFKFTIKQISLVSATSYFFNIICGFIFAYLAHKITDQIGITFSRKLWTAVGLYGGAISLILLAVFGNHKTSAVVFLMTTIALNSATHPGYMNTILSVAPNLAGAISGTFNTITSVIASTGPIYTGFVVENEHNYSEWANVFLTGAGVFALGSSVYLIFGSTELQEWDYPQLPSESEVESTPLSLDENE